VLVEGSSIGNPDHPLIKDRSRRSRICTSMGNSRLAKILPI